MKVLTVVALLAMAWFAVATNCASEDQLVDGGSCQKEGAVCNDETTTGGLVFCICEASQWKCSLHGGCNGVFCDEERVMTEGDSGPAEADKVGRHGLTSTTRSLTSRGTDTTNKKPHTHVHNHVHVHDDNFKCSQLPVKDGDACTVSGANCYWEDSETSSNCICSIGLKWECYSEIDVIDASLVIDLPISLDCPTDPVETGMTCSDDYAFCRWNYEQDFFTDCSCISSIWECTDWGPNGWANCPEEPPADEETCSHRGSICYWTGNSEPLTSTDCFCSNTSVWECIENGEFGWIGCPALPTLSNFSSCDTENAFCFWDMEEGSSHCSCFDGLWTCYEWPYEDPYNCSETPSENGTSCSVTFAFCSWEDGTEGEGTECYCSENSIWECSEYGPYGWIGCTDEPFPAGETCGTNGAFCYWEQESSYTDCFCYKNAWDCFTEPFFVDRPAYDCPKTPVEDGETCSTEGAYCSWIEQTDIYSDCTCSSSLKWECYESGPSWYEPPNFDCPEDPLTNGTSCAIPDYASCSYSNGDITTQCDCFGSRFNRDEAWHCTDRGPFGWVGCPSKPVSDGTTCTGVSNYSACIWPDGVNSIECSCFDSTWECYEYSPFGSIGCPSEPVSHGISCSGMEGSFCYWEEQGSSYVDCFCDGPTWECYKNGYVLDDSPGMPKLDDPVNLAEKNSDQHDPKCFKACNAEAGEEWICKEKFLESGCEDCNDPVDICTKLCNRCGGSTADAMIGGLLCDCSVGVGDGRN